MPKDVIMILKKLNNAGFEAYIVGGCVRDKLLGQKPNDYDITTSATPQQIKDVFYDYATISIGEKFGTIGVVLNEVLYEITTFRIDGKYLNNRKPVSVTFSHNLEDDLARRDFTINAMAMDIDGNIFDPFCGKLDLENKIIRSVGNPSDRILEDGLRIMRAIRFAGRLNFYIDEDLFEAISLHRDILRNISVERIFDEFLKMLTSTNPSTYLLLMEETGVLDIIFPEIKRTVGFAQMSPFHDKTLFDHILCVVDNVPCDISIRLAALFHDVSKVDTLTIGEDGSGHFFGHEVEGAEVAKKVLRKYKVSNKIIKKVEILILDHMKVHSKMSDKALRRQIKRVGKDNILDLYSLLIADCKCTRADRDTSFIENRRDRVLNLLNEKEMKSDKFLNIDGNDIIALGYQEGKQIGDILRQLENIVLDNPKLNNKKYLIDYIKENYKIGD